MLRNITDYTKTIQTSLIHKISNLVLIKGMMHAHLNNMVATMVDENNTMPSLASTVTNDTFLQESGLTNEQKKRKLEEIYSNGRFQEEDEYEILKVRQVVRQHIFKHLKFCKGEGKKSANNFDKKAAKVLAFGKSHEKADLTKTTGYEYNVMKLTGYCQENRTLTDRAMWWKSYNDHVIEEIRQLRGRTSSGIKLCVIEGM